MLAAGGGYTGDNISTEGNLSMTVLDIPGVRQGSVQGSVQVSVQGFVPFRRIQTFVLAHLAAFNSNAGDLRWTLLAVALRALNAAAAFGQRQLARWARGVLRRAWQGARFAAELGHADSMVAAGGR